MPIEWYQRDQNHFRPYDPAKSQFLSSFTTMLGDCVFRSVSFHSDQPVMTMSKDALLSGIRKFCVWGRSLMSDRHLPSPKE